MYSGTCYYACHLCTYTTYLLANSCKEKKDKYMYSPFVITPCNAFPITITRVDLTASKIFGNKSYGTCGFLISTEHGIICVMIGTCCNLLFR